MLPPTPPPHHSIPAFSYRPAPGSHGVAPHSSIVNPVSATSLQGGYPDINNTNRRLTKTQINNTLRLLAAVWGSNKQEVISSLFGGPLDRNSTAFLAKILQKRFGAVASNPIYHMVQEAVESHDLDVHIRNLARTSILCRRAVPGETATAVVWREKIATEYQAASFDLRDRALVRLDSMIIGKAAVQAERLKSSRERFAVDPFVGLDADGLELSYFKFDDTSRKALWLSCYDENVVAWYWQFRGVMDIRTTIAQEPFTIYSKEEFAHTCDSMSMNIVCQSAHRGEEDYHKDCREFNQSFNRAREADISVHDGTVSSLGVIMVWPGSFDERNGYQVVMTQRYEIAIRHKHAGERNDEDY